MRKIVLLLLVMMASAACNGLAGEPDVVATIPPQQSSNNNTTNAVSPPNIEPDLALGAAIYAENCTRCHGIDGKGEGELVQTGQVEAMPDFTDPATVADTFPAAYYEIITNGRMEKLMPPWSGSLNDEERWAVAMYVYTMSEGGGTEVAQAPVQTEEAVAAAEATAEPTVVAAAGGNDIEINSTGTFSGLLTNGSQEGTTPTDLTVTLRMIDQSFNEETFEASVGADGRYSFAEVPILPDRGYIMTTEYGGQTFTSEMVIGDPHQAEQTLDLMVYDTTTDPSVLTIDSVVVQVDGNEQMAMVVQIMQFSNNSNMMYVNADDALASVRVTLPEGADLSPANNDLRRYKVVDGVNTIYDTRPVLPGMPHQMHLVYTMPPEATISHTFDYPLEGYVEIYAPQDRYEITDMPFLGTQQFQQTIFNAYGRDELMINAGEPIQYGFNVSSGVGAVTSSSPVSSTLAYALVGAGLLLLGIAGYLFVQSRGDAKQSIGMSVQERIQMLMHQVADLDSQHEANTIDQKSYEQQRAELKAEIKMLMQSAAAGD